MLITFLFLLIILLIIPPINIRIIKLQAIFNTDLVSSSVQSGLCFSNNFNNNSQTPALARSNFAFSEILI